MVRIKSGEIFTLPKDVLSSMFSKTTDALRWSPLRKFTVQLFDVVDSTDEIRLTSILTGPTSSVCNGHFNSTGSPSTRLPSFNSKVSRMVKLVAAVPESTPANKWLGAAAKRQHNSANIKALDLVMRTFLINHHLCPTQIISPASKEIPPA